MTEEIGGDGVRGILCGNCDTKVDQGFERDGVVWGKCAQCGQEDPIDVIQRTAAEHYARRAVDGMFGSFSGTNIKVTKPSFPHFRWKAEA